MNEKHFSKLYRDHAPSLYSYLTYRVGDPIQAEDLLADTFERALRSRTRFDPRRGSEKAWLYAIALNCVRDGARRSAAETRALAHVAARIGPDGGDEADFEALDRRDALRQAMAKLSDDEREALALRYGADLTLADTAAAIGEPQSTVETRIYRGLRRLHEALDADS